MVQPKLSIIVPSFNGANHLEDFLSKVPGEHTELYEILVMDGGSTDDSESILNYYAERLPHLKYVSEKDRGIYDAMNKGIDAASGSWLYFCGLDDEIYWQRFKEMIPNLKGDVVYANVHMGEKVYDGEFTPQKLVEKNICHQAMFFNITVFIKHGKYSLKYKLLSDYLMNIRLFGDATLMITYMDEVIAKYGTDGLSSSFIEEAFILKIPSYFRKFVKQKVSLVPAYNYIGKLGLEHIYKSRRWKGMRYILLATMRGADKKYLRFAISNLLRRK